MISNTHPLPLARVGDRLENLSTPLPVIDEDRLAANIARVQSFMDSIGKAFRPHIKTHKIPAIARQQVEAGAQGINCQKITEAEIFADAGFGDILITFNIMGAEKLDRLAALNARIAALKVVADSAFTIDGLAGRFGAARPLTVLVECDTGAARCGVQTSQEAVELAVRIAQQPGLVFGGLMTYPKPAGEAQTEAFLAETIALLAARGLPCPIVSGGGSPSLFSAAQVPSTTEHRAGTYVYNDRSMVRSGHCTFDDCAMHILATVVSRPTADRAILDAGSKALTSDLLGFADHGLIVEYPDAIISGLSEEHGTVDLSKCTGRRPEIGEKVRIIPNHTCVVSNLFDTMTFHRGGVVTRTEAVAARGLVW